MKVQSFAFDLKKLKKYKRSGSYARDIKNRLKAISSKSESGDELYARRDYNAAGNLQGLRSHISMMAPSCEYSAPTKAASTHSKTNETEASKTHEASMEKTADVKNPELLEEYYFETSEEENGHNFVQLLREWALKFNIAHTALNSLLKILKSCDISNDIPKDCRSLLRTPREVVVTSMGDGEYWHNGLCSCLQNYFSDLDNSISIALNINIDGLPLCRSSKIEFWPILVSIHDIPKFQPMVIGMYCGKCKPPSAKEFLTPFVNEAKDIIKNGILINNHKIAVRIRCFICDTPARSFIKGTVNFNGYNACLKCTAIGEYHIKGHHMSYPRIDSPRRTDKSFRQKIDLDHHKADTPLEDLPVNMVDDIVIGDSLHLVDLGIMKKLLTGWSRGSFNFRTKWSASDIKAISNFLLQCRMPNEIHRAVRSLDCLSFWKGLEFRTFLFYIGPVVLKHFLSPDVFKHFILFFCAITILSCEEYSNFLSAAEKMLEVFIEQYIEIYGIDSIGSNVHNLCHLTDEVKKFGSLPTFSAYPFENMLYKIKCLLRTGNNPLPQVARRIIELNSARNDNETSKELYPILKNEITIDETDLEMCRKRFSKITLMDGLTLTRANNNKWFLTRNGEIVAMKYAGIFQKNVYIYGSSLKLKKNLFDIPIKSSHLNIFESNCEENSPKLYALHNIKCKLVCVKDIDSQTVFLPLIHTLDLCNMYKGIE